MDIAGTEDAVLAALDPEQREVALAVRGPVCVLAGAGTGKTRAVAHRIAYAAAAGVVPAGRMLAVTFTTRAAGELRGRLRQLSAVVPGAGLERVTARTFHSAALRQLNHFWPGTVGGPPPAVISSKLAPLAEAATRLRLRPGLAELRDLAAEVEWAKVTQVRPEDYAAAAAKAGRPAARPPEQVAAVFAGYEQVRRERHLADFESVLELTAAMLASYPMMAAAVRERYRYFVVDEYQDVNPLQQLLLEQWAGERDDVCVVGDPRQTIYSFTGATPEYLTGFALRYPGATVLRLVRNYRSTPQVIGLANRIGGGTGRGWAAAAGGAGELIARRRGGPEPELTEYPDEMAEAEGVARLAAGLVAAGVPAGEIAVLVRTNAQTAAYESALGIAGVPFRLRGVERFFERPEVRQAIGLLKVAARAAGGGAPGREPADDDPRSAVRALLSGLGLTAEPPGARGQARDRWESLDALARLADEFFGASPGDDLAGFAAELQAKGELGLAPGSDGVTLASLHAAKGLEWDAVFLPGLADGTVPIIYAVTPEAIEEERRLLYVGVTRARERLYLSWATARAPGGRQARKRSRFLDGAPVGRRKKDLPSLPGTVYRHFVSRGLPAAP